MHRAIAGKTRYTVPGLSPKAGAYALRTARQLGPAWVDDALHRTCMVQQRIRGNLPAAAARLLTYALIAQLTIGARPTA